MMSTFCKIFLATILMVDTVSSSELIKFKLSSYLLPNKEISMALDVVIPRSAGTYPVIIYLTGL
jgi:hypothetical protein